MVDKGEILINKDTQQFAKSKGSLKNCPFMYEEIKALQRERRVARLFLSTHTEGYNIDREMRSFAC